VEEGEEGSGSEEDVVDAGEEGINNDVEEGYEQHEEDGEANVDQELGEKQNESDPANMTVHASAHLGLALYIIWKKLLSSGEDTKSNLANGEEHKDDFKEFLKHTDLQFFSSWFTLEIANTAFNLMILN